MATSTYTPGSNDIIHKIDLDLVSRSRVVEPIHMVQNDKVLPVLAMSLYKEGTSYSCPSGSTVSIRLEKPDKKVVNIEVSGWDSSRHIVYMKTTYQMTSAFGKATALLEIDTGSGIAQTETFPIMIDRNPVQDGSIESTDEIKSLQGYVDAAAASASQAQTYRDTAGTYANSARTSATEANNARSQASGYATNAELAKTSAQNSAAEAEDASDLSKSYAVGTNNTVRPGDKTDNSKAYSELAQRLTDQATALLEEAERLLAQVNPEGAINPDTPITFQQAAELANIQNEDSIRIALGKLSKLYASLESGQLGNAFSGDIVENRALISDANGKITSSDITSTELSALDGISGNVQEKLTELIGKLSTLYSLDDVELIPGNSDMNDYTSPGNYLSPAKSVTNTLLNCPHTGSSFIMHVERIAGTSGFIKQRIICNDPKPIEYWRNQTNGIFRNWDKPILNSDLGYVDCEVSSKANDHVAIPNAPSSKDGYIPVIIHHSSSDNVLDHVFYDSEYWWIYSTLTQVVIVRFYKYPI